MGPAVQVFAPVPDEVEVEDIIQSSRDIIRKKDESSHSGSLLMMERSAVQAL